MTSPHSHKGGVYRARASNCTGTQEDRIPELLWIREYKRKDIRSQLEGILEGGLCGGEEGAVGRFNILENNTSADCPASREMAKTYTLNNDLDAKIETPQTNSTYHHAHAQNRRHFCIRPSLHPSHHRTQEPEALPIDKPQPSSHRTNLAH